MNFIYKLSDKQKNMIIIVLTLASLLLLIYIILTYKNNIYEGIDTCSLNAILNPETTGSSEINDFTQTVNDKLYYLRGVINDIEAISILPIEFSIKETNKIAYDQNTTITVGGQMPNVELTLNLPESVPGVRGETGIVGNNGSKGDMGSIGKKGPMGYWGSQ